MAAEPTVSAPANGLVLGIAGARRNAAAAIAGPKGLIAVCEQERVTRVRGAGMPPGRLPDAAIAAVTRVAARPVPARSFATTEDRVAAPPGWTAHRFDHHQAHATTAFWSSPAPAAIVLVCDRRSSCELTVWRATSRGVEPVDLPWRGPAFASLYSRLATACGFAADDEEHWLEALARLGAQHDVVEVADLIALDGPSLRVDPGLWDRVAAWTGGGVAAPRRADVAATLQRHIGRLLQDFVRQVHATTGGDTLCLSGGLFFNSYFTTAVAESGAFARTSVAVNPGNAGVAAGAALIGAGANKSATAVPPFLGPEYSSGDIKATLDNCKLSYAFLHEGALIDRVVTALAAGRLVGWFQGRMEWGPRALGGRSILASPIAPHVADNLNLFLKRRESHRPYSVSVCDEDLAHYFSGPQESPFMSYEYVARHPDLLAGIMPSPQMRLRVQSVGEQPALLREVLRAFGDATGTPVLVNTSFNGFHEPIVCSPRDAVRVFYGTGLDAMAIGGFWITK